MSPPDTRATLEAQQRREAEYLLTACAQDLQRVLVARAEGVTDGMIPRYLRPYWRELGRQADTGAYDLDITAMAHWLRDHDGSLDEVTGREHARHHLANAPLLYGDGVHCREHAHRLVEASLRLSLIEAHQGQVASQAVQDDEAYREHTTRASEATAKLAALRARPRTWVDEVVDVIERALNPDTTALVSTGYRLLDEHFGGGWGWGWLVVVMGPAKSGKSALAINSFARAALRQGYHVLVVSLEMTRPENVQRFLAAESDVPVRAQRRGDLTNWQKGQLNNAGDVVASWHVDVLCGLSTVDEICAAARVAHAKGELHMLVVDYLQLVHNGMDSRVLDLEHTTRALKLLANSLGIVVILLSQPNNADAKSGEVGLFSGKGTGAIAADCDALLVPLRDSDSDRAGLVLAGCRHADAKTWSLGSLTFSGARMCFEEPAGVGVVS